MATEEDKKMAESWKADADGILIFVRLYLLVPCFTPTDLSKTGLFSAAVASLISVSIQDIRPSSQDTSNFYLANIFEAIADPNRPNISLPLSPPTFSPPTYAVWVNSLWFMSLVISLTCALLATLLQQWARRYLKVTQTRYSPHKRARIRAFFFEGVGKFLLPWAVEVLPALLHISLFLFFSGLVVFLCNVNLTAYKLVFSWVGICGAIYGCITFMPIFRHDSPYYTPLTSLVWHILIGIPFIIFRALLWSARSASFLEVYLRLHGLEDRYRRLFLQGMQKAAEETALKSPSEIDTRAFMWTFDCLDEDHELEHFFAGLPGFRSSRVVKDPLPNLTQGETHRIFTTLIGLLDRTFSSDLLPKLDKNRRAIICAKAVDPAEIPYAYWWILDRVVFEDPYGPLQSVEIANVVKGWDDGTDVKTSLFRQAVISGIVARTQRRDDLWFAIASDEMGVPESVLRDYATQGNNLSLAILVHITRQQFNRVEVHGVEHWRLVWDISQLLEAASKFNIQDTSPDLQHEFCALWNQIVLKAQSEDIRGMANLILGPIRHVYIALHHDTESAPILFSAATDDRDHILYYPSSYPVCNIASHICDDSACTSFPRTFLHDSATLVPTSLTSAAAPFSSMAIPLNVDESLTTVPPPDNLHLDHQSTMESLDVLVISPGQTPTCAIPAISVPGVTIPHHTPETSDSLPSDFPAAVPLHHNTGLLAASDSLDLPSSVFSNTVLYPAGQSRSSQLPIDLTSGHVAAHPESQYHRPITVTAIPSSSPGPTSVPALRATSRDGGSPSPDVAIAGSSSEDDR